MNRIFLILAVIANVTLAVAAGYGLAIDSDGSLAQSRRAVSLHLLLALCASLLVLLLHSAVLTYFMATGRWIEEASAAYRLDESLRRDNIRLKYRVIPAMVGCIVLVILTGAAGAMSDPVSKGVWSPASAIHLSLAVLTVLANLLVTWTEYRVIGRNSRLVSAAWEQVQRIRAERGLSSGVQPRRTG